jgi:hypothetical protein
VWSAGNGEERDAAAGLVEYAAYLDGELETHLRGYVFWLMERRTPRADDKLPGL